MMRSLTSIVFIVLLTVPMLTVSYSFTTSASGETGVVEPSPVSLWAESKVGSVYAQETHYVKPSPDGRYLYIYNMDTRNIIVLDLETRTIVQNVKMPGFWAQANEMIFSSDGQQMYTLSAGQVGARHIVVFDTKAQKIDRLIRLPKVYQRPRLLLPPPLLQQHFLRHPSPLS